MTTLTPIETRYVDAYQDVIAAVSSVDGFVSASLSTQLDSLELMFDWNRVQELRDIARERFNRA